MAGDCNPFVLDDFAFPRRPENRAALARIGYRIGRYPDFVEYLVRQINDAVELRAWTHRGADDPGIALMEGAAILGDILTFYQERYANEAFLRTATWRESIADLVRLTGYRLAPGVGGLATFAFEVKGDAPVAIPAGFPLKADLEGLDKPAELQTEADLTAYAYLSRFHLYRPRSYATTLAASTATTFELQSADGTSGPAAADAVKIKAGDRLMLLPAEPAWTSSGGTMSAQQAPQIVKVKGVRRLLDRTIVDLEAPLAGAWTAPATAYRLGRSFRHFGHNAPATYTRPTTDTGGKIDGAEELNTGYLRDVSPGEPQAQHSGSTTPTRIDPFADPRLLPLDQEVKDLAAMGRVVVQTRVVDPDDAVADLTVLRTAVATRADSLSLASVTGATTVLTLDAAPVRHGRFDLTSDTSGSGSSHGSASSPFQSDVRDYQIHEVTSPALALAPEAGFSDAAFADGNDALCFFGTRAEAQTLPGRRLILAGDAGRLADLTCTNQAEDFVLAEGEYEPRLWTLSFDAPPAPYTRADFDEALPAVTVYGNLADATQGKAKAETVLGNGDGRSAFQTFKVPKKPLTYLLSAASTPPQVPELEVRVNGRLWTRVESFFGRGPLEEVYLVREDADGSSYVQFGDGETGARLPSGVGNVKAAWRTGSGAHGALKAGATPSAGSRVAGLDKVQLPGPVTGGADPESEAMARRAAPGKVQGLGRLVSLADYESEALAIPGITTARAAWGLKDGVPSLTLNVLMAAGREVEFAAVRTTLQSWQRCRGPDRFPVVVEQAFLRYLWLDVIYAADPALAREDVEAVLRAALGLAGVDADAARGLFGVARRRLGEKEYASRIAGTLQQVAGVVWCQVTALGMFAPNDPDMPEDDDPATLVLPAAPRSLVAVITPQANELLQLADVHLTLTPAAAEPTGACA